MRRAVAPLVLLAAATVACGGSDAARPSDTASVTSSERTGASPSDTEPSAAPSLPAAIDIVIEGDRVQPNGKRISVGTGEPVMLVIDSDRPGELHVHSSPEQTFDIDEGRSEIELSVYTPGVVDVEEHESGVVVLRLEVR